MASQLGRPPRKTSKAFDACRAQAPVPPGLQAAEYGLENGVLVIHVQPPPARRVVPMTHVWHGTLSDGALADVVNEALQAVADEASDSSTDHYESDAAVEDGQLRLWFGVVPPSTSAGRRWGEVIAELPAIPVSQIERCN